MNTKKERHDAIIERILLILMLAFFLSLFSPMLWAQPVQDFQATLEVTSTNDPDIQLGDKFVIRFWLDYAATDADSNNTRGAFPSAGLNYAFYPHWSNSGSGRGCAPNGFFSVLTYENLTNRASFQVAVSEGANNNLSIAFFDQTQTAVNDTGGGQTLEMALDGFFDPANFLDDRAAQMSCGAPPQIFNTSFSVIDASSEGDINKAVPVPAFAALALGFGLLVITLLTGRQLRQATR